MVKDGGPSPQSSVWLCNFSSNDMVSGHGQKLDVVGVETSCKGEWE